MRQFFLDRRLRKIEKEANDDLLMIIEAGPQYYTNQELYHLLDKLGLQEYEVLQFNRKLFLILASVSVWFILLFFAYAVDIAWLSGLMTFLIFSFILAFAVGKIYLHQKFRTYKSSGLIRSIIQQELERRQKDASIS